MKTIILMATMVLTFGIANAQCDITSVKVDSYGIRVYKEGGSSQSYQYDGKSIYDYSSCWLAVARTGGNITIYDGKSPNSIKSISTNTSKVVKSVKVLGDKVKIEYEGGEKREYDIK